MILRIVRMVFQQDKVSLFNSTFDTYRKDIAKFQGVHKLELYQDAHSDNIFYTYSLWESLAALEVYRHSALFKEVWGKTKPLFAEKPQAFSLSGLSD